MDQEGFPWSRSRRYLGSLTMTRGDTKRHGPRVIEVRFRKVGEITVSLHANRKVISFSRKRKRALADTHHRLSSSRGRGTRIHGHQGRARPCPRQLTPMTCGPGPLPKWWRLPSDERATSVLLWAPHTIEARTLPRGPRLATLSRSH
jgi:hypothetical protein